MMSMLSLLSRLRQLNVHIELVEGQLKIRAPKSGLTPDLKNQLKDYKDEIIKFLKSKIDMQVKYRSINPVEEKEYYLLSSAQKRMYFIQQLDLKNTVYNMTWTSKLEENPTNNHERKTPERNIKYQEAIFRKLIRRHESLRTSFEIVDSIPVQKINREVDCTIQCYNQLVDFVRPFNLSVAPLFRVGIIKQDNDSWLLAIDIHHIIADGISLQLLIKDFQAIHQGKSLSSLRLQYKDYSQWQNSTVQKNLDKNQQAYWLKKYSGEIPLLDLPIDFPRPTMQSLEGNRFSFNISNENTLILKNIALENGTTLYITLLSFFYILMSKLSGQEDIIIGVPTAGRRHADLEGIIGMFVNTLALRNYPAREKRFKTFLLEVNQESLEAFENQDYQFEELVEKVSVNNNPARNPLFDVMFVLQGYQDASLLGEGPIEPESVHLDKNPQAYETRNSKFDLSLYAVETGNTLSFTFQYCTKLFEKETILRFSTYFKKIISIIVNEPDLKFGNIDIVAEDEKYRILYHFNDTAAEYPKNKSIHQLFEAQTRSTGSCVAIVGPGMVGEQHISYRELNEKANGLAALLQSKGADADTIVAVEMQPVVEIIVGILAILKAGAAYMPIEFVYPHDRKKYLLADSKTRLLFTYAESSLAKDFPGETICLCNTPPLNPSDYTLQHSSRADNLAYIIYTSGSTGIPKGALISHQNVIRLVKNTNYFEFRESERLLQSGALAFDASTFEIWGTLLNGLQLCLVERENILLPEKLQENIRRYDIAIMWMTSPLFNQMSRLNINVFSTLRHLVVGGDILSVMHINRLKRTFPLLKITNGYGPTENTTFSATFLIENEYDTNIPIGKPIANSTVYIVGRNNHLQPVGIPGELLLGGDGVARGYLNDPELTSRSFVSLNPPYFIIDSIHNRLYKTGDLGKWRQDGNIDFLGRIDNQVKVRGNRVELGEIESQLLKHESVKEAVIVLQEKDDDKFLCAYIVPGKDFGTAKLTEYLSRKLPSYMIPSCFVLMERIPLTSNGKLDKNALPIPTHHRRSDYVPPSNEIERQLVRLFASTLGKDEEFIGVNDSFFDLGGHSLTAVELVAKIHRDLNVIISLPDLFTAPTVKEITTLANVIQWAGKHTVDGGKNGKQEEILL
jgi:amino acid adenylation domain-containing protein